MKVKMQVEFILMEKFSYWARDSEAETTGISELSIIFNLEIDTWVLILKDLVRQAYDMVAVQPGCKQICISHENCLMSGLAQQMV